MKYSVESVKCEVLSVEREVWRVVWSVVCGVWRRVESVDSGVRSVKRKV